MARKHKDVEWELPLNEAGQLKSWDHVSIAVLMDIRDRLDVPRCPNFLAIPGLLREISKNTAPRKSLKLKMPKVHDQIEALKFALDKVDSFHAGLVTPNHVVLKAMIRRLRNKHPL